jgi:hypothetical protein
MERKDVEQIVGALNQLVDAMYKEHRPKSGQRELSKPEEIKKRIKDMAEIFFETQEMKAKMEPIIHDFLRDFGKEPEKSTEKSIAHYFPELNAHEEAHALMNLQVHLLMAGPFRKLSEDIIAKILDEQQIANTACMEYLFWRSQKVREEKGQH